MDLGLQGLCFEWEAGLLITYCLYQTKYITFAFPSIEITVWLSSLACTTGVTESSVLFPTTHGTVINISTTHGPYLEMGTGSHPDKFSH